MSLFLSDILGRGGNIRNQKIFHLSETDLRMKLHTSIACKYYSRAHRYHVTRINYLVSDCADIRSLDSYIDYIDAINFIAIRKQRHFGIWA